jgi:isoleucyl-tRNA synthetase
MTIWMAPVLCFTAQDIADELSKTTGETFDIHGFVREDVYLPGREMGHPNRRWTDEIRPRREAILRKLEAFRAAGHKSLEAWVKVRPAPAERPNWMFNAAHLTELCVVSGIEIATDDAPGVTEITVEASAFPECPRCWRRPGPPAAHAADPNLCVRCAGAVT